MADAIINKQVITSNLCIFEPKKALTKQGKKSGMTKNRFGVINISKTYISLNLS